MTGNQLLSSAAACQCQRVQVAETMADFYSGFSPGNDAGLKLARRIASNELRVAFLGRQTFERSFVIIAKPQPRQGHFVAGQVQIVHLLRSFAANRARHFHCVHALHFIVVLSERSRCIAGAGGARDAVFPALGTASPRDTPPGEGESPCRKSYSVPSVLELGISLGV
jgi:hypothetical protein